MRQINIKNDAVADLLDDVTARTDQGKPEAIPQALTLYWKSLDASKRAEVALALARDTLHPAFDSEQLGRAPDKQEQETLLGL